MTGAVRTARRRDAALAGIVAIGAGIGVGELVAAFVAPTGGPITDVGGLAVDLAPAWAKDAAIALFGTADKLALIVGIALVLALLAAAAGVLESIRPPIGTLLVVAAGAAGVVATATRAQFSPLDLAPPLVTAVVAILLLRQLVRLAARAAPVAQAVLTPRDDSADAEASASPPTGPDRRRFLAWAAGSAAVGVLAGLGGWTLRTGARVASAARDAIRLPAPVTPAPAIPADAAFDLDGLTSLITPNAEFYRIDTALQVPVIDPAEWRLRVHGQVEREVTLGWEELLALPLEEHAVTLACVSNEVGGSLIGNATWLGYPIAALLERAGVAADADMVLSRSIDGFTAGTPLEVLRDGRAALLAIGMNGEPLPAEHGFPVRLVVPGLYGYVSATKWVTELEVTRFDRARAYWTDRGWSERGPVKLSSRIDVPREPVAAGTVAVAGVAWYQHVGVERVEVRVDGGDWQEAELASAISDDTWVQWRFAWDATPGSHELQVRAVGADGIVQTSERRPPAPDGATGLDRRTVEVR
ncbi:molybdopterin-dependent oxidoreductase [Agromyces mediolanus]|uniref:molybdopterin-dependent oxidoreductase n=1 Tax=Agromyces mediolanus TaxID=41986 RepID=UPI00204058E2|nr:molybdopterin-dependent oxidoreductase [Agromyces mediolanus]MCM3657938.1 molybdopterin-dependent oxidoreductase [Agromyces mediolanus]